MDIPKTLFAVTTGLIDQTNIRTHKQKNDGTQLNTPSQVIAVSVNMSASSKSHQRTGEQAWSKIGKVVSAGCLRA